MSLSYFLLQDDARKELIILDEGEESVAGALPQGAKRNRGCSRTAAKLSAHETMMTGSAPMVFRCRSRPLIWILRKYRVAESFDLRCP